MISANAKANLTVNRRVYAEVREVPKRRDPCLWIG